MNALNQPALQFGLDTFGDTTVDDHGQPNSSATVIREVVAQAVLADQLGIDAFNVGEHHRQDFAISAPDTVLAGIAGVTKQIRLGTGVTVLSSDDPVRVYQRFATLQALSNGRAEITAGRGSFTESFPLFGYDLADYAVLFEEKLELLVALLREQPVTWSGSTRAPLKSQRVWPELDQPIGLRVGVGGSPESVVRAARLGLPLALAIIGGEPARFAPFAKLYRDALVKYWGGGAAGAGAAGAGAVSPTPAGGGGDGQGVPSISVHSPGHIAATDEQAIDEFWPHYRDGFGRIGRERGWAPMSQDHYLDEVRHGSLYVGSPATVAAKIAATVTTLGASRFDLKYSTGPMPHTLLMRSIELYGTEVAPRVRSLLAAG